MTPKEILKRKILLKEQAIEMIQQEIADLEQQLKDMKDPNSITRLTLSVKKIFGI